MPKLFEELTCAQLQNLPLERTVFFFPVAPLEDHGPHLPMGLDVYEAKYLSLRLAEKLETERTNWRAVIMPHLPMGINSNTTTTALTVRGFVLRDFLVDTCKSLTRSGFRYFVCVSGHGGPRQLTAIEEAGRLLERSGGIWPFRLLRSKMDIPVLISASSALVTTTVNEHGGKRDTSVALKITPSLVAPLYSGLPSRNAPTLSQLDRLIKRLTKQPIEGYWGAPAGATAEEGGGFIDQQVDIIFPRLCSVLDGAKPQSHFRSGYSILPWNKTFFKAWLLSLALILLMFLWMMLVVAPMIGDF